MSPRATRLVVRLLTEYRQELADFLGHAIDEDDIADASNDLGYVDCLIKGLSGEAVVG
jgi:hypothetical protein